MQRVIAQWADCNPTAARTPYSRSAVEGPARPTMISIQSLWQRITSTRHTRALEIEGAHLRAEGARQRAEIDRLRAENRALLNSILGIAGVPPITVAAEEMSAAAHDSPAPSAPTTSPVGDAAHPAPAPAGNRRAGNRRIDRNGAASQIAAPLRRRSWHQINRMLEFESARKAVTSD